MVCHLACTPCQLGVQLHDDQVEPPGLQIPGDRRGLPLCQTPFALSSGKRGLALYVGDARGRGWAPIGQELPDQVCSFFRQKHLYQSATVQIEAQERSSLT